jgi:hypothetical protein
MSTCCRRIVAIATRNQGRDAMIHSKLGSTVLTSTWSRPIPSHRQIQAARWAARLRRRGTPRPHFAYRDRYPGGCSMARSPSGTAPRFRPPRRSRPPSSASPCRVRFFHALATDCLSGLFVGVLLPELVSQMLTSKAKTAHDSAREMALVRFGNVAVISGEGFGPRRLIR